MHSGLDTGARFAASSQIFGMPAFCTKLQLRHWKGKVHCPATAANPDFLPLRVPQEGTPTGRQRLQRSRNSGSTKKRLGQEMAALLVCSVAPLPPPSITHDSPKANCNGYVHYSPLFLVAFHIAHPSYAASATSMLRSPCQQPVRALLASSGT